MPHLVLGLKFSLLTQHCTNFGDGLVNYFKLDHCVIGPTLFKFGLVSFIVEENSSKNIAGFIPVLSGYCLGDWFSGRFSHRKPEVLT